MPVIIVAAFAEPLKVRGFGFSLDYVEHFSLPVFTAFFRFGNGSYIHSNAVLMFAGVGLPPDGREVWISDLPCSFQNINQTFLSGRAVFVYSIDIIVSLKSTSEALAVA